MQTFDGPTAEVLLERIAAVARNALACYDLPAETTVSLINHSENMTYRVDALPSGRKWALRVHREGYHTRNGIASELAWMNALREEAGVPTPIAVRGRDGALIHSVGAAGLPRPRNCVLFEWLAGAEPEESGSLTDMFEELGEISGRIHRHSKAWRRPADFERLTWDYDTALGARPHWGRWQDGMGLDRERVALLERVSATIRRRLDRYGKDPARYGVIHGDLRLANLLVDENGTRVIDFDDCGWGWYMYDYGTTLSFIEDRPDVPEPHGRLAHRLPPGDQSAARGRGGDPHLRDAAPPPPGGLDRLPRGDRVGPGDGRCLHRGYLCVGRALPEPLRMTAAARLNAISLKEKPRHPRPRAEVVLWRCPPDRPSLCIAAADAF